MISDNGKRDIVINNLDVCFQVEGGNIQAVDQANIRFKWGQTTGIIGETGSGKSVLGLSILGLLQSNAFVSGDIFYNEYNLTKLSEKELGKIRSKEISLVAQNPAISLNPSMKIGKQIAEAMPKISLKMKEKERQEIINLLQSFGFEEPEKIINTYPYTLSGGMAQRVLTAIAVAAKPSWIIADEPTKGLDPIIRGQVRDIFQTAWQEFNASTIVITHDLLLAHSLCDFIIVMYAGKILETGNAKDFFEKPLHPYSRGLLESLPSRGMNPMKGFSPAFTSLPKGCVFHPRCPVVMDICEKIPPAIVSVGEGSVSCHRYNKD